MYCTKTGILCDLQSTISTYTLLCEFQEIFPTNSMDSYVPGSGTVNAVIKMIKIINLHKVNYFVKNFVKILNRHHTTDKDK